MYKIRNFFLALSLFSFFSISSYAQLTPNEAALLMQKGINLGNTLEPPLEGGWNNPPAQEYYFDLYKEAGFSTVRIPVRWDEHTQRSDPYAINEDWMQRVEQIADWALERGLFVILNAHHEEWIKSGYQNALNRARFDSIWSQIAFRFQDKSERLLFEIINEPYGLTKDQNNELHARILSIIRKTNPTRIVIIQGHNWGGSDELIAMTIPEDDYLIGSFHSYDPYQFGLQGTGTWGTSNDYIALRTKFESVKAWSVAHNIPVILGEFGSVRTCDYNSRMKHYRAYVEYSQQFGFVSCAWDDGGDFKIMNRAQKTWDETKDILISTTTEAPKSITLKIIQDTVVRISWLNAITQDSIFIEHRTPTGNYKRIASLQGDSTAYTHLSVSDNMYHHYRIIAYINPDKYLYSQPVRIFVPQYVPKTRSYYLGQPLNIPGTIEAEHFDLGGEGLTFHDATQNNIPGDFRPDEAVDIYKGGEDLYLVGSIWPGEWLEYTVDVATSGTFRVDTYIAAYQQGGIFDIKVGESMSPELEALSSNSMVNTSVVTDTMELTEGIQIMRLTIINDHPTFNIDKIVFTAAEIISAIDKPERNINTIKIYNVGNLKVSWSSDLNINRLDFYTLNGSLVKSINKPVNNNIIPNTDFPEGIYVLKASSRDKLYTTKFRVSPK